MNIDKQLKKEIYLYMIFGILTTIVDWTIYTILRYIISDGNIPSADEVTIISAISWAVAVVFAYITNRKYVFKSDADTPQTICIEFISFVLSRLMTGIFNMLAMRYAIEWYHINDYIAKAVISILIVASNYLLSKLWAFRKNKGQESD